MRLAAWHVERRVGRARVQCTATKRRGERHHRVTPLDARPGSGTLGGELEVPDFRFIMLHVITETACHAGHLDAARELLDRRQWIVL
jgi:hypothetical protein